MKFSDPVPDFSTKIAANAYFQSIRQNVWGSSCEEDLEAVELTIEPLRHIPDNWGFNYYEQIKEDIESQRLAIKQIELKQEEYGL